MGLSSSRILEVGCGVGFLGLHLLKSVPSIKRYIFTDGHEQVLRTVCYNLRLNLSKDVSRQEMELCAQTGAPPPPQPLPWEIKYNQDTEETLTQASIRCKNKFISNYGRPYIYYSSLRSLITVQDDKFSKRSTD